MKWEDPPPARSDTPYTDWPAIAAELRARPGE